MILNSGAPLIKEEEKKKMAADTNTDKKKPEKQTKDILADVLAKKGVAERHPAMSNLQNKPLELKKKKQPEAQHTPKKDILEEKTPESSGSKSKPLDTNKSPEVPSDKGSSSPPKSSEALQSPPIDLFEKEDSKQSSGKKVESSKKSNQHEEEGPDDPLNQVFIEDNEEENRGKGNNEPEEGKKQDSLDFDQLDKDIIEDPTGKKLQKVFIPETNQELYMDEEGNVYDLNMNCIGKIEEEEEGEMEEEDGVEEQEEEVEQMAVPKKEGRNKQKLLNDPDNEIHHSN